jgi:hypothetical protein
LNRRRPADETVAGAGVMHRQSLKSMMPRQHTSSRATILACLLPIAVVAAGIARWGVNIPYVDQFTFVALLEKLQTSGLTLADLFAQNNENRPFFPRLIWLVLAGLSHYDVRLELWANLIISSDIRYLRHAVRTWRISTLPVPTSATDVAPRFQLGAVGRLAEQLPDGVLPWFRVSLDCSCSPKSQVEWIALVLLAGW